MLNFTTANARAENNEKLKVFLTTSAYGTVTGALVGLASLAFVEDPGSKTNSIARGASLGLYGGIALGLYLSSLTSEKTTSENFGQENQFFIFPNYESGSFTGTYVYYNSISF